MIKIQAQGLVTFLIALFSCAGNRDRPENEYHCIPEEYKVITCNDAEILEF